MSDLPNGYEWNHCYYKDCVEGMRELPDKCVDLGLTDPPYNLSFKGKKNLCSGSGNEKKQVSFQNNSEKIYYSDENKDFTLFVNDFLEEMIRVCNWVILTPGHPNLYLYIRIKQPSYYIRFWYKPNDMSYILSDPVIIYGKSRNIVHMPAIFKHNLVTVKKQFSFEPVHPCPKQYSLWLDILNRARPKSVLDPFLGSGTTSQACEELGIKWLGFEICEDYHVDIDKRIRIGISTMERKGNMKANKLDSIFNLGKDET